MVMRTMNLFKRWLTRTWFKGWLPCPINTWKTSLLVIYQQYKYKCQNNIKDSWNKIKMKGRGINMFIEFNIVICSYLWIWRHKIKPELWVPGICLANEDGFRSKWLREVHWLAKCLKLLCYCIAGGSGSWLVPSRVS